MRFEVAVDTTELTPLVIPLGVVLLSFFSLSADRLLAVVVVGGSEIEREDARIRFQWEGKREKTANQVRRGGNVEEE